jgi:hypothetical protein
VETPGAVLYICGEGFGGVGARIKACKIYNKTPAGTEIYVIRAALNLRSSADDFDLLMASIKDLMEKTGVQFELVQIDTLARAFGAGNENNSEDMAAFIHNTGRIQRMLGCSLMVVHHSGKDALKGLRGHSSLLGAVDTQLELAKIDATPNLASQVAGSGILTVSKQKDGETGVKIGFEMVKVEIQGGTLGIADAQISLAVRASDEALQQQAQARKITSEKKLRVRSPGQDIAFEAIHKAIKKNGYMTPIEDQRHKTVSEEEWKEQYRTVMGSKKKWTNLFDRAVEQLVARKEVGKHITPVATYVWVIYPNDDKDEPFVVKD